MKHIAILLSLLVCGCATRGYVDDKCYQAELNANKDASYQDKKYLVESKEYTRMKLDSLESRVNDNISAIKEPNPTLVFDWDKFEQDVDAAILEAKRLTEAELSQAK